jgi:hypothetical protein
MAAAHPNQGALLLKDASKLLQVKYMATETGYTQLEDGMWYVAAQTYMPNVTGAMIDWWFGFIHYTDDYKLWHPRDHVFSDWEGPRNNDSTYIGGTHLVHEYIGGRLAKLKIRFRDPAEYFGANYREDFAKAGVSTAVCGRVADWDPEANMAVATGHLIHLIEDTADGCRMRSRFWLGDVEGVGVVKRSEAELPISPAGLCQHATEEMAILAKILPDLFLKAGPSKL